MAGDGDRNTPPKKIFGGSVCAGEDDGAEFAQNRQIPDRKEYFVRRGRVLAIENGKEKKPGDCRVSSLDFVKEAHSLEVLHTFRELAFLKNPIFVFRFMTESTRMQKPRRRPTGVFHTSRAGDGDRNTPRRNLRGVFRSAPRASDISRVWRR